MIIAEYYRAYLVALRLGHDEIATAFTLEGESANNIIYMEIFSHVANGMPNAASIYQAAFVWAAQFDHFLIMRALLAEGCVAPDGVDVHGRTALSEAIRKNSTSALITLLAQGIRLDESTFKEATEHGTPRTMRTLLRELWLTSA